jgi:RNA polymerase sigma factor (sigma-70 family)
MAGTTAETIDAVWRIESPRIIAAVARIVRDIGLAEEFAQDALVAALEQWPQSGVPDNPAAWLTATAKRRAIDHLRRSNRLDRNLEAIGRELQQQADSNSPERLVSEGKEIEDDLLRLIFTACHPILPKEARVALTLRLLGGLTTPEIARAFFVSEATMAQRIVRAKRTLAEAQVPFEAPEGAELGGRLASVLEVIYLIFNEGYAATSGERWTRPDLAEEALRLGRIIAELLPGEAEVHGLVALIEIQASRMSSRLSATGEPVLLLDQNRSRWDYVLIRRGLLALERAKSIGETLGPYALQASIAACHAQARRAEDTDWERIAALYDALAQVLPSPVVDLNRAVAIGMAYGPAAALEIVDALRTERALDHYHLLPAVRGDLLRKLDRYLEAKSEFERAAAMTSNEQERRLLLIRAQACSIDQ